MTYTYDDIDKTKYQYGEDEAGKVKYINISDTVKTLRVVGGDLTSDDDSLADNLREVRSIGGNVEKLDDKCFYMCRNLTAASLGDVTYIGDQCFEGCGKLKYVDIFDKTKPVFTVGDAAFIDSGISSLNLMLCGMSYETPDDYEGCVPVIKENGPYAGVSAFARCGGLLDVRLCCSTDLGAYMFAECGRLSGVEMVNHGSCVGERCFKDCVSLKDVSLPSHFEIFSEGMFEGCSALTSLQIQDPNDDPSKFMALEDDCLSGCSSLEKLVLPKSITSIYTITGNCLRGSSLKELHFTGIDTKTMDDLAEVPLTEQSFDIDYISTSGFKYGKWYGKCKELIDFAKKKNAPIMLYECNAGCGRCDNFQKSVLASDRWNQWMVKQNMFFAFGKTQGGSANNDVMQVRWDIESKFGSGFITAGKKKNTVVHHPERSGWTYYPQFFNSLPGLMLVWWNKDPGSNTDFKYAIDVMSDNTKLSDGQFQDEKWIKEVVKKYFSSYTPDVACMQSKPGNISKDYLMGNRGADMHLFAYDGQIPKRYTWNEKTHRIIVG